MKQMYLSDRQVAARYNVRRETVWRWSAHGDFPSPIRLGPNSTRWNLTELEAWEAQRTAQSQVG